MVRFKVVIIVLVLLLASLQLAAAGESQSAESSSGSESQSCPASKIPFVNLYNGVKMPVLALGTANLVETPGTRSYVHSSFQGFLPERTFRQMELALTAGVRSFDTALIYNSQPAMASVLGEWFRTGRLQDRRDIFVISKIYHPWDASDYAFRGSHLYNARELTHDQVSTTCRKELEQSLLQLNLGYVDVMLLHWPSGLEGSEGSETVNRASRIAAWKVLEDAYKWGWARAIGVSNFSPRHIDQLMEDGATLRPMVNQFEASVTLQYPDILQYCKDHQIIPQAYSPLGRGISQLPELVGKLAEKYKKDEGQISFRYLYQLGYAVTYLTTSADRMVSNTEIFDFELSPEEMEQLNKLNRPDGGWGLPNPHALK